VGVGSGVAVLVDAGVRVATGVPSLPMTALQAASSGSIATAASIPAARSARGRMPGRNK
jgi:hypothetical protein